MLERWVRGVRYHVSTRCTGLRAALKHLERFESSPQAYLREERRSAEGLVLTSELVEQWRERAERDGLTPKYVDNVVRVLGDWLEAFDGSDLRHLSRADVERGLRGRKQRQGRIIALKTFFTWLRATEGLITTAEDVTVDVAVPQGRPEKHVRRKAIDRAVIAAVFPHLEFREAAVVQLLCATAWHVEEVRRFAVVGELVPGTGDVLAVLQVRHKSGELTRTPVKHPLHVFAAECVRAGGRLLEVRWLNKYIWRACDALGLPRFRLGHMRHTVLTWAKDAGATMQDISEFAGHKSPVTTRRFYVDQAVPTVAVPVTVLQ